MRNGLLALLSTIIALACAEGALRLTGWRPGEFQRLSGFSTVSELVLYENFITDEFGIYKFSPWITDSLRENIVRHGCLSLNGWRSRRRYPIDEHIDDVERVYTDFRELKAQGSCSLFGFGPPATEQAAASEFSAAYRALRDKHDLTTHERALLGMVDEPFNAEGFRGIAFDTTSARSPKVLVIGDSFVYGMSATPWYNSFTDILLARGYMVYSAGIPGIDPAQYAAIAMKYVPTLRPDVVVVCLYPGNDLMRFPRQPHPNRPPEHLTNAGFFESNPAGGYLTPKEAYDYYRGLVSIPTGTGWASLSSSTALTSLAWGVCFQLGKCRHTGFEKYMLSRKTDVTKAVGHTRPHLVRIDSVCQANGTSVIHAVIPDVLGGGADAGRMVGCDTSVLASLYGGTEYHFPAGLFHPVEDFKENDYHFNNSGSTKFAGFLIGLLRQRGFDPAE